MKTNQKQKKNIKMKKAWIIRWVAFGDEERIFSGHKVRNRIIDVISPRYSFEKITSITQEYYIQKTLSLYERVSFQHYINGRKNREEFLRLMPSSSHCQTQAYKDFIENDSEENKKIWLEISRYYYIGHNPAIEAREVYDLVLSQDEGADNTNLSWKEKTAGATHKYSHILYEN